MRDEQTNASLRWIGIRTAKWVNLFACVDRVQAQNRNRFVQGQCQTPCGALPQHHLPDIATECRRSPGVLRKSGDGAPESARMPGCIEGGERVRLARHGAGRPQRPHQSALMLRVRAHPQSLRDQPASYVTWTTR